MGENRGAYENNPRRTPVRLLPLHGVKKRRDSSPNKRCSGDHAKLGANPKVLRMLAKHDESRILFTGAVLKVNREGRPKERVLLLSGNAIYVLKPGTFKCGSRIEIRAVSKLTLSTLADNFCLVSGAGEGDAGNDLLFSCSHKTEFVSTVQQAASDLLGLHLPLEFANEMTHRFNCVYERKVTFLEDARSKNTVHTKLSEPVLRREQRGVEGKLSSSQDAESVFEGGDDA
ncbi:TH1 domain-containing protein [Chloropicon primus]|uniref:TH1 domain-containing protein n=1 Tax=Chloropicon primus TaxID=1764295 RepID=A0A5B8MV86_9CHLO|nr:hypothetical protein A3770_10p60730 [Chloropicon primus]UPR02767.1 TH1 domain-containing protein [Chloropicon primus]|eukprot:QDZ23555.1 hypothetical protein A3770_10p60730 [Chloropicon primus]